MKTLIAIIAAMSALAALMQPAASLSLAATASQTQFIGQDSQHDVPVTIQVTDMTQGFYISRIVCSFGNGVAMCNARASECVQSGASYACILTVSPVDYATTGQGIYDPSSRSMTLSGNSMTVEYSSSSGSGKATLQLPDITLEVQPVCGNGACERIAGESPSICCVDCGCPYGQYCYTGGAVNGQCVDTSQKQFYVSSFEPKQATAVPFYAGGKYLFPASIEAKFKFSVGRSFVVEAAGFRLQGKDYAISCEQPSSAGEASCGIELPPISPQEAQIPVEFFAMISFMDSGVEQAQALKADARIPVTVQRPPVENCMDKLTALDDKIGNLSDFISSQEDLCKIWDDNKAQIEDAAKTCCDSKADEDCICGKEKKPEFQQGAGPQISNPYMGQDQSCYLCAKPCICDTLPTFDALLNAYKSYRDHLSGVCSATEFKTMASSLSLIRTDISTAEKSMNLIKKACEPVTKKWDGCPSWPSFPDCKRESGLVNHENAKLVVSSAPLPSKQ